MQEDRDRAEDPNLDDASLVPSQGVVPNHQGGADHKAQEDPIQDEDPNPPVQGLAGRVEDRGELGDPRRRAAGEPLGL